MFNSLSLPINPTAGVFFFFLGLLHSSPQSTSTLSSPHARHEIGAIIRRASPHVITSQEISTDKKNNYPFCPAGLRAGCLNPKNVTNPAVKESHPCPCLSLVSIGFCATPPPSFSLSPPPVCPPPTLVSQMAFFYHHVPHSLEGDMIRPHFSPQASDGEHTSLLFRDLGTRRHGRDRASCHGCASASCAKPKTCQTRKVWVGFFDGYPCWRSYWISFAYLPLICVFCLQSSLGR